MKGKCSLILLMLSLFFFGACDISERADIRELSEARADEKFPDIPQRLEELSNEFKGRTCLVPRRMVQLVHFTVLIREQKLDKNLFKSRLKGENLLYKISAFTADCQIHKFAALLCRNGYYVYALRKLLI